MIKVENIYQNKVEIEEFNNFSKAMKEEKELISIIFDNVGFIDDLICVLERLKALEEATGILNELTSEQIKIFDEVVRRRDFFDDIHS